MSKNTYFGSLNAIIFGNTSKCPKLFQVFLFCKEQVDRFWLCNRMLIIAISLLETFTADVRIIPT